jgi:hypothetical protein
MAENDVIIRRLGTNDLYQGSGDSVPDGFEVIGPASGVGATPEQYVTKPETKQNTRQQEIDAYFAARSPLAQLKTLGNLGKQSALPTIGALGGAALGGRLGTPGRIVGESAGSMLGTAGNMALGLEPWSATQLGVAGGLGPAMRMAGGVGRKALEIGAKMLPGSAVARHEMGRAAMEGLGPSLLPKQASGPIYAQVEGMNPTMWVPHVAAVTQEIETQILKNPLQSLESAGLKTVVGELKTWMGMTASLAQPPTEAVARRLTTDVPAVQFENLWAASKSLRAKIQDGLRDGSLPWGRAIQIRKAMLADLESAAQQPGTATNLLKTANESFKKEVASDTLGDYVRLQGMAERHVGASTVLELKPAKVLEWMRKDPADIMRLLAPEERAAIESTLKAIVKNSPRLPPAEGASTIFRAAGRLAGSLAFGSGLSHYAGQQGPGAYALSAAAGALTFQAMNTVEKALMTEPGRKLLEAAMKHGPFLDHPKLAALAIALRSPLMAEDTERPAGPTADEKKILKAAE